MFGHSIPDARAKKTKKNKKKSIWRLLSRIMNPRAVNHKCEKDKWFFPPGECPRSILGRLRVQWRLESIGRIPVSVQTRTQAGRSQVSEIKPDEATTLPFLSLPLSLCSAYIHIYYTYICARISERESSHNPSFITSTLYVSRDFSIHSPAVGWDRGPAVQCYAEWGGQPEVGFFSGPPR